MVRELAETAVAVARAFTENVIGSSNIRFVARKRVFRVDQIEVVRVFGRVVSIIIARVFPMYTGRPRRKPGSCYGTFLKSRVRTII